MRLPTTHRRDVTEETFAAVLLDSDSTLVDSGAAVERSWAGWARRYRVPVERLGDTHGMPSRRSIARIDRELGLGLDLDAAGATFDALELDDLEGVVALPGALEALEVLGARGAVVTSAGRELAGARLRAAGLPTPTVLVSADDVALGKPDPGPYLEGAARLGVDAARCLVVEDSVAGVRSGRDAGAATLALLTTTPADRLGEADLVVPDLSAVRFTVGAGGVRVSLRR
ncbi:HAD family hydrolase [Serinicoccus sp. LYQ131]|uniref:HAD family hydrolase n=1 Tax=Serinicoccus sp. LYQ131 TaxID=3378797 RepID=UPI003854F3D1